MGWKATDAQNILKNTAQHEDDFDSLLTLLDNVNTDARMGKPNGLTS
jgi:hypothetical protein